MDKDELELWMKMAEFRGSTITALKGINSELKEMNEKLEAMNNSNKKRDIKVASIAGSITIIILVLSWILPNIIGV